MWPLAGPGLGMRSVRARRGIRRHEIPADERCVHAVQAAEVDEFRLSLMGMDRLVRGDKHPGIPGRLGAAGLEPETPRFERRSLQVWFRRLGSGGELAGRQEV
jgi:hypothetical protein